MKDPNVNDPGNQQATTEQAEQESAGAATEGQNQAAVQDSEEGGVEG